MLRKAILLLLIIGGIFGGGFAQNKCGTDDLHSAFLQNIANLQKHNQIEQLIYNATENGSIQSSGRADYVLPVVVHIIHNDGVENISDLQVNQAIDYINQAFRNTPLYDSTDGVDTRVQFCLAKQNPQGQATSGINRIQSSLTNLDMANDLQLKNLVRWNPSCYINIWVVKSICSQGSCNVGGYAYLPTAHGSNVDGIVVLAATMGAAPSTTGTPIHELGHYLGLYHTFQGGCTNNNCMVDGDKVCDTPPDASTAYIACNGSMNSCNTDAQSGFTSDQPDMHKNYMDYTAASCRTIFTAGQRDRMLWHIANVRGSLLNCYSCNNPCPTPVVAKFTPAATIVPVGTALILANTSTGASTYQWLVNGVQFATSQNASYSFNNEGHYAIRLIAKGGNIDCFDDTTITIKVTCGVVAQFNPPNTNVAPNVNYSLTNTSTGSTSYRWLVDGIEVGTSINFSYSFPTNGIYWVQLISCSDFCCDTSTSVRVFVCNPCIEVCDNGIDDDGDNLVDCFDPDCSCDNCSNKQNNVWTFGEGAGMDFRTSPPTPFLSSNQRAQASASIADPNGNLVFYTDGYSVFDRYGDVMQNGTGLTGSVSSTQHLIIQHPAIKHLYYLFITSSYDVNLSGGISYSIVDMSLNYGLGAVTNTKNIQLMSASECTEKLTAVRHCNNKFTWIIAKERYNNVYRSYLIDSSGLNTTPVSSAASSPMLVGGVEDGAQVIKISPDGKLLANPLLNRDTILLLKFDNKTGVITEYLKIGGNHVVGYCGAEFSPSGNFLYASRYVKNGVDPLSILFQFDLRSGNAQQISTTRYAIDSSLSPYPFCACQLGSDGKIYVAYDKIWPPQNLKQNVPYIENPDVVGANCNYNKQGVVLPFGYVYSNLPSFVSSYFLKPVSIVGEDTVCTDRNNILYKISPVQECASNVIWNVNGGTILSQTDSSINCRFNTVRDYQLSVKLENGCSNATDTLTIFAAPCAQPDLGPDTAICVNGVLTFKAGPGYRDYIWHDGLRDSLNTIYGPGIYYVQVQDIEGNTFIDTILVGLDSISKLNPVADTTICSDQSIKIDVGDKYTGYGWSPPVGLSCGNCHDPVIKPSGTTTYTVTAKTNDGCVSASSITVFVDACIGIDDEIESLVSVYPNPASGVINIRLLNSTVKELHLHDATGRVVKNVSIQDNIIQLHTIDISDLASGVYILRANAPGLSGNIKVTIQ